MQPTATRQYPKAWTVCILASLMLFLMLASNASTAHAHGFRPLVPYDLPVCTARVLVCEAPSSLSNAESANYQRAHVPTASAQAQSVRTPSNDRGCIDGSGAPRSCDLSGPFEYMPRMIGAGKATIGAAQKLEPMSATNCVGGAAGPYPCSNIDLLSFIPLSDIGGGGGSDIWGWTDPDTGKEYALMGRSNGTSFVDISDPENPIYLGNLPAEDGIESSWRDIKVYSNHAFIVADDSPFKARSHGMQVFDLTQLRTTAIGTTTLPITFASTAVYTATVTAHNIAINEETGFAYIVGSQRTMNVTTPDDPTGGCRAGLHMVDITTPANPTFAGCFSTDGYTHDTQCVIYTGPDAEHQGREICFNSNEDTLTIVDVTDKSNPVQLSRAWYASTCVPADESNPDVDCFIDGSGYSFYTHQGWLTEDQTFFLQDDELDELGREHATRTYIWDVQDLDNPILKTNYETNITSLDHNLYTRDRYVYQANYTSGLRVLDAAAIETSPLFEVAYFDIHPGGYGAGSGSGPTPNGVSPFDGAWSNYPYFDSGVVIVSGISEGLFVLRPNLSRATVTNTYMPFIWQQ